MNYEIYGHRNADFLFAHKEEFQDLYDGLLNQIDLISDEEIIQEFENEARDAKSISQALNRIIKRRLVKIGWAAESYIFADAEYAENAKGTWRLDFATEVLSVEVAFNHRSDISWNLIKPTLASELNHVKKNFHTKADAVTDNITGTVSGAAATAASRIAAEKDRIKDETLQSTFDNLSESARVTLQRVQGFRLPSPNINMPGASDFATIARGLLTRAKSWHK